MNKSTVRFPSVKAVAADLRAINYQVDDECDVRLQVYDDGGWAIRFGDSSYDLDHRGYWGASFIPGNGKRFNSTETARDLIDQARDHHAQCQ